MHDPSPNLKGLRPLSFCPRVGYSVNRIDKGTHMIRYVFDNKAEMVAYFKSMADRLRVGAKGSKPARARELQAEAWGLEQAADMLQNTWLRDTAAIQADPKI